MPRQKVEPRERHIVRSLNDHVRLQLRARREQLRVSQEDLGAALGMSRCAFRAYEYGDTPYTVDKMYLVATYLRMDVRDLVHGYVPPSQRPPGAEEALEPAAEIMDGTQPDMVPQSNSSGGPSGSGTLWDP